MGNTVQDYTTPNEENFIINEYILKEKIKLIAAIKKRGIRVSYQTIASRPLEDCNQNSVFDEELGISEVARKNKLSSNAMLSDKKDGFILFLQSTDTEEMYVRDDEDYNTHITNIGNMNTLYFIDENDTFLPLRAGAKFTLKYDTSIVLRVTDVMKPRGITKFYQYNVVKD